MPRVHHPLPTHNLIHQDPHDIIAIVGPWGSGKSTIAAIEIAYQQKYQQCDALVVRDTYPALKDSCCAKWEETFRGLGQMNWGPPPTWHWTNEMAGLKVLFRSAESPEDIQKFGSVETGVAWLEEVTPGLLPGGVMTGGMAPEVLAGVLGRLRKWGIPKGQVKLFLTALPPPSRKHWFHTLFYDKQPLSKGLTDAEAAIFTQQSTLYRIPYTENLPNLPPNYYALQAAFLTDEDQRQRFLFGEVGSAYLKSAIYGEQFHDNHINANIAPHDGPMLLGIDGGLDASAVWIQPQPSGRLFVLNELCSHGIGLEDFALAVFAEGNRLFGERYYTSYADPSIFSRGEGQALSGDYYLRQSGLATRPSVKEIAPRITGVRTWLNRHSKYGPIVQIHPRCENLIEGFRGGYHWKTVANVPLVGTPDKNEFSHVHDALQYVLTPLSRALYADNEPLPPLPRMDSLGRYQPTLNGKRFSRRTH